MDAAQRVGRQLGIEFAQHAGRGLIDLIYPPRCLVCDFPGPAALCEECVAAIASRADAVPAVESALDAVVAVGRYEGVLREAIHQLKYGRRRGLALPLGELLAQGLKPVLPEWQPNTVLPVPIHWSRRLRRGFNQAEMLADEVARIAGLRVDCTVLARVRRTRSQVGLSGEERRRNLSGAFRVRDPPVVAGRSILLVDDVHTTGTTLAECARVLRAAGARTVYGLVLSGPHLDNPGNQGDPWRT